MAPETQAASITLIYNHSLRRGATCTCVSGAAADAWIDVWSRCVNDARRADRRSIPTCEFRRARRGSGWSFYLAVSCCLDERLLPPAPRTAPAAVVKAQLRSLNEALTTNAPTVSLNQCNSLMNFRGELAVFFSTTDTSLLRSVLYPPATDTMMQLLLSEIGCKRALVLTRGWLNRYF